MGPLTPRGYRRFALTGLVVLCSLAILVTPYLSFLSQLSLRFATGLFAAELIRADCRLLGRTAPHAFYWVSYFVWPFTLPYHVVATRGWKRALKLSGWAVLYFALVTTVMFFLEKGGAPLY